jgi:hypothetical protein
MFYKDCKRIIKHLISIGYTEEQTRDYTFINASEDIILVCKYNDIEWYNDVITIVEYETLEIVNIKEMYV